MGEKLWLACQEWREYWHSKASYCIAFWSINVMPEFRLSFEEPLS